MITAGNPLPQFSLQDDSGTTVTEKSLLGKWSVLYFYPKDDTPGCTTEACSLRDAQKDFLEKGVSIYGISKDSVKSHVKFREKFHLTFPLLADVETTMAQAFGVWVEKSMYGKKYMGMERSTFIVNPEGTIVAVYPKVDPVDHGPFLLQQLAELMP
ncbi:MAG TPA: thioredoxin-dependent thiol peroxidase [Verrucomicrobiae bacterium]|nr:thioredoxin-dependent thiol peroxidase [Verrucomicrobiae bacterium]